MVVLVGSWMFNEGRCLISFVVALMLRLQLKLIWLGSPAEYLFRGATWFVQGRHCRNYSTIGGLLRRVQNAFAKSSIAQEQTSLYSFNNNINNNNNCPTETHLNVSVNHTFKFWQEISSY